MFYLAQPPGRAVQAVISDYTLMSEAPPRNPREALEEDFVLDFLVLPPSSDRGPTIAHLDDDV